jgi:hypothetical protein
VSLYSIHLKMVVVRSFDVFIYLITNRYLLIHATNIKCSTHDSYICFCSSHKKIVFILFLSVKETYSELNILPPRTNRLYVPFEWQVMCPLVECKLSLVIKENQIKVSRLQWKHENSQNLFYIFYCRRQILLQVMYLSFLNHLITIKCNYL